jgi:hypothetical protein
MEQQQQFWVWWSKREVWLNEGKVPKSAMKKKRNKPMK